jgi:hypothetical protein
MYLQYVTYYKHLLQLFLHLTGLYPKNIIVSDFVFGGISIQKGLLCFAMSVSVSLIYPLNPVLRLDHL